MSAITHVRGLALALPGDDIDTDRIMPARFLKAITFAGLEAHVFADDRQAAAASRGIHPFDDADRNDAAILVVGANFGCGSSREHAPQGLYRRGIRAILGISFAEIFLANAQALGLVCASVSADAALRLMHLAQARPAVEFAIDLHERHVRAGEDTTQISIPDATRHAFLNGTWDAAAMLLADYDDVARVDRALPY